MDKTIKDIIKKEITPLLIGIRNDFDEKTHKPLTQEVKGVLLKGKKGDKGDNGVTPIKDKDYPSNETIFNFIKENLPQKGKDYFTDNDIQDIVYQVKDLIPVPKDGKDGIVDYNKVKDLVLPLISARSAELEQKMSDTLNNVYESIKKAKQAELTADQIRNKLESLNGNARLDAKAIKGLENYLTTFIATSSGGGGGSSPVDLSGYIPYAGATASIVPLTDDTIGLGSSAKKYKTLYLTNTGTINFGYGNIILTGSIGMPSGTLTLSGKFVASSLKGAHISSDNSSGVSGSFTTANGKTVTVKEGIITAIV